MPITRNDRAFIFNVRENFSDFMFINAFLNQDFVNRYQLFVTGKRLNRDKMVWEYYIKSRKAKDYRQMIFDSLYHPPHITVVPEKSTNDALYLMHHFEHKPLVSEFIANTMLGIEYLWGGPVLLETHEVAGPDTSGTQTPLPRRSQLTSNGEDVPREIKWRRVRYRMENRKLTQKPI